VRELSFRLFLCLSALSHMLSPPEQRTKVETSLVGFKCRDK
jgi:hypothetical protein